MKSWMVFYFKFVLKGAFLILNYPLQRIRKTTCYITCSGNSDGAGAQAHAVLSTILFAKLYGLEYVHTPFSLIQHNQSKNPNWEQMWEEFFSFGLNRTSVADIRETSCKKVSLRHPLLIFKRQNLLYKVRNCHECTDMVPNRYHSILNEIRRDFKFRHFGNLTQPREVKKISIHVRRGDVSSSGVNSGRFTEIEVLTGLVEVISKFLSDNSIQYEIDIYSQGSENEFVKFKKFNASLKLNLNEFDTFKGLVNSDILITAKSSFSYTAALLSDALVFYDKFWHGPLKSWVNYCSANPKKIQDSLVGYFKICK
jgi:hypothetical protein